MPLTEETRLAAKEIVARYPRARSALLPMLHLVQSEEGYVSPEGVRFCADELGLSKAEVGAVATFYTMYKRRPTGDYLVSVCTNTLCDVLGGQEIYETLSESLGVGHDETTADGTITLEHAECLAACDYAPVVTVNYEFFDQQTVESASSLVGELQAGRRPMPTRGAPLCSFREISRQLAGFLDERPDALDAGPAGEPTVVGNRLAVQRGETAPPYDAPAPIETAATAAPAAASAGTSATADSGTAGAEKGGTSGGGAAGERAATSQPGERAGGPSAEPDNAAEKSAAEGTARYGGPPDQPSSGGAEGGAAGLETSASDPDSSSGSGVTHEVDTAKADGSSPTGGTGGDSDAASDGAGEIAGPGSVAETGDAQAGSGPGAVGADAGPATGGDTRRPTNRARKSPRKER